MAHRNVWLKLATACDDANETETGPSNSQSPTNVAPAKKAKLSEADFESCGDSAFTFDCIQEALQWVSQGKDPHLPPLTYQQPSLPVHLQRSHHIQVLATGSLHLIGGIIKLIEPHFNDI